MNFMGLPSFDEKEEQANRYMERVGKT